MKFSVLNLGFILGVIFASIMAYLLGKQKGADIGYEEGKHHYIQVLLSNSRDSEKWESQGHFLRRPIEPEGDRP